MPNYGAGPTSYRFIERLFIKPFFSLTHTRWCRVLEPAPDFPPEGIFFFFFFSSKLFSKAADLDSGTGSWARCHSVHVTVPEGGGRGEGGGVDLITTENREKFVLLSFATQ